MAQPSPPGTAKPRYEPVLQLPPLSPEDFEALRNNIGLNGVMVPILVDCDGPVRRIIDGNHRKAVADELGYPCPEIFQAGLEEEEIRALARALNLARRQFTPEQKRQVIADQLQEMPQRSNRCIARQLGVHHATVASVRAVLEATGQLDQLERTVGADGKSRPAKMLSKLKPLSHIERETRLAATTLIHGDCRQEMRKLPTASVDAIITDPIYPEVDRAYGRITEDDWHSLMHEVVTQSRRVLRPCGSMLIILQPNYNKLGQMRLWLWEFMTWAGREWNLIQDTYWWAFDALPLAGTNRSCGLLRQSVKTCVWLGPPNCFRKQEQVLCTPSLMTTARRRSDQALRRHGTGHPYRNSTVGSAAAERGGTTPYNLLPVATGPQRLGTEDHPASTPYEVASWWARYLLPTGGTLLDPFVGSGTMLVAGLDAGASRVIGIDQNPQYLETCRRRVQQPS